MPGRRQRVLAYVTRERDGVRELLVFDQPEFPDAGTQVPAGRLDEGESLEEGLRRELHEEAGLDRARLVRELDWPEGLLAESEYENHAFELVLDEPAADRWDHVVFGDGDDAGYVFRYRWEPIGPSLRLFDRNDPLLEQLM
jgi:8-oxo-dGTP pyrophosphatase MutT (NUDIX family)